MKNISVETESANNLNIFGQFLFLRIANKPRTTGNLIYCGNTITIKLGCYFGHVHRALFSEARVRLLPRDRKVTVVTARLNGKWPSTPKYRAKMVDATQKVQTVILDGAKIFFGRHGSLRPTMKIVVEYPI